MILIDTSVWIDYLRDLETPQTRFLDDQLGKSVFLIGDLILMKVLQGVRSSPQAAAVLRQFRELPQIDIAGYDCAVAAAHNYRTLWALGFTPPKTIDTLIATRCMLSGLELLHADRDFELFERHLGLAAPQFA